MLKLADSVQENCGFCILGIEYQQLLLIYQTVMKPHSSTPASCRFPGLGAAEPVRTAQDR